MRRCTRVRDLLGSYLAGDVSARERQFVERHLADCQDCAGGYQAGRGLLGRLPSDVGTVLPDEAKARILRGVRVRRRELAERRPSFLFGRTARGLVFAATVCGAAAVAIWLTLPPPLTHTDGVGAPAGTVGESSLSRPAATTTVTPAPAPSPPVVAPAPPTTSSLPAMGLRGASSNRHLRHVRGSAKKADKKKTEEEEKAQAAASAPQEPAKDVVAPTPTGPDDATVVTPSAE